MTWEDTFKWWAQGPSETEQTKYENTERAIREALNADEELSAMEILVFAQGSYKSRTNVRLDSDVDICVLAKDQIFSEYPNTMNFQQTGLVAGSFTYADFKNLVEKALIKKFGQNSVNRGNKAFDIHANSYRVDADVVPAFVHRHYTGEITLAGGYKYHTGVEFRPDNGGKVINWPDHTYENGLNKNSLTARKYKRTIRVLKRLRNKMQDEKISTAENIGSFLIESLVWNVPNNAFEYENYYDIIRYVLAHAFNNTMTQEKCQEWGEVNELKYLFRNSQPWTREQAHNFLSAAWDYIGY